MLRLAVLTVLAIQNRSGTPLMTWRLPWQAYLFLRWTIIWSWMRLT